MASVTISTNMAKELNRRLWAPQQATPNGNWSAGNVYYAGPPYIMGSQGGTTNYSGRFLIMQGTVPSDFSTLTTVGSRSADILVNFNTGGTGGNATFAGSTEFVNPLVLESVYRTASATGTATWFHAYLAISDSSGNYSAGAALSWFQMFGTVGTIGSGADLEMPTTSIVSGEQYRIYNMRFQLPLSWTY